MKPHEKGSIQRAFKKKHKLSQHTTTDNYANILFAF